ncbi:MAG: response regulator, partial [Eubacteriales bacterium]|nr:response regulator [Eubacteriales bacterium]
MEERKVLLIADDDEMSRRIIKRFLKDTFDILEAEDGEQALELLHTRRVDGVLLDILMPKMDGLQVLERLRADDALARVGVLVATSTKEQTERAALSLGADDVVSK